MDVLEKIDHLRNQRGWSDYEMSKKSGVPQTTISSLRRNKNTPTISTLEALCKAFGITMAQFFADDHLPLDLTEEQRTMLERWNRLDEKQKTALLQLMENMI